jgi:hypothetical protein
MDRTAIERIITECGCTPRIREMAQRRANGEGYDVHYHVLAYKRGYRGRSLGKLEIVARLSEEALRNRVLTKFAKAPMIFGAFFEGKEHHG